MHASSRRRTASRARSIVLLAACPALALGLIVRSAGPLSDLAPAAGPFDGARAKVRIVATPQGSRAVLRVRGIGAVANGQRFGAHLHDGPCVAGNGAAAGPHYNSHVHGQTAVPGINDRTEIWLDFTVVKGKGTGVTSVPFVPEPGSRSIVVHALPTNPQTGVAGERVACLTVSW